MSQPLYLLPRAFQVNVTLYGSLIIAIETSLFNCTLTYSFNYFFIFYVSLFSRHTQFTNQNKMRNIPLGHNEQILFFGDETGIIHCARKKVWNYYYLIYTSFYSFLILLLLSEVKQLGSKAKGGLIDEPKVRKTRRPLKKYFFELFMPIIPLHWNLLWSVSKQEGMAVICGNCTHSEET